MSVGDWTPASPRGFPAANARDMIALPMDPVRYNRLVERLEAISRTSPTALRRRVAALIALGYAYVLTILLGLVAALVAVVWIAVASGSGGAWALKLVVALGVVTWLIARSLWVTTSPPDGRPLPAGRAPRLEQRVEEIRRALDAPRADTILLTEDFNASVTQIPRLGIFGWPRTYLVLGLPLMHAIEPGQLDAVLAHEFAHLSGAHTKWGLWVYRMSLSWRQLLAQLDASRSWGRGLFQGFVRWYAPRLQAYGFVMSRRDEYEADAEAAKVTSAEALAAALVALEVRGAVVTGRFWPEIWRGVESSPTPPSRSWSALPPMLQAAGTSSDDVSTLRRALARQSLDDDTHPALADRLAALGVAAKPDAGVEALATRLLVPVRTSAAEHYLEGLASELTAALEAGWREAVRETWEERHGEVTERRRVIAELSARDAGGTLQPHEVWELACAVADVEDEQAAAPLLRRVVEAMPRNAAAHFMLGRAMLGAGEDEGAALVRRAGELDPRIAGVANEILRQHFAQRGDRSSIEATQVEQHQHEELMRLAALEREDVNKKDTLVAATLSPGERARLAAAAEALPRVKRIWVARKQTKHLPQEELLVILIEPKWWRVGSWRSRDRKLVDAYLASLRLDRPAGVLVSCHNAYTTWLLKKMRRTPGALVYERGATEQALSAA